MIHADQNWFRLGSHRFFLLFLLLLGTLLVYPYAESNRVGYVAFRAFGSGAIIVSVYAASVKRSLAIFVLVLAVPAILQRFVLPIIHVGSLSIVNFILSFAFDVVIVVVIFRHVFSKEQANTDTIFGALCIYLLVGFSFASLYGLISVFEPNAFYLDPHANLHGIPDRFDFIYYSFGTMTALGSSGITPVTAQARAVSVLEAILGVLYLAVLVARLMGAYRITPRA